MPPSQIHAHGAGVFITVNETDGKGRKKENITRIRAVFQEDDDGFDGEFPLKPSIVVETSPELHRLLARFTYDHGADWPLDWRVNAVGEGPALTDIA